VILMYCQLLYFLIDLDMCIINTIYTVVLQIDDNQDCHCERTAAGQSVGSAVAGAVGTCQQHWQNEWPQCWHFSHLFMPFWI
jgi:hypothetical protein